MGSVPSNSKNMGSVPSNLLDSPETKQTYDRLVASGISDQEARRLIGYVVSSEIFDVLKQQQSFDHARFVKALNRLPQLPWE